MEKCQAILWMALIFKSNGKSLRNVKQFTMYSEIAHDLENTLMWGKNGCQDGHHMRDYGRCPGHSKK